jgi:hypothetical protein
VALQSSLFAYLIVDGSFGAVQAILLQKALPSGNRLGATLVRLFSRFFA